jgi:hypothetical protein
MPDEILEPLPVASPVPGETTGAIDAAEMAPIPPLYKVSSTPTASIPPTESPEVIPQRIPYWLQQAERLVRVIVRMYVGLLLCWFPWWELLWDNNPLFVSHPTLLNFVTNGAVRGIVSGLGLLNLWIALRDALRPVADPAPGGNSR